MVISPLSESDQIGFIASCPLAVDLVSCASGKERAKDGVSSIMIGVVKGVEDDCLGFLAFLLRFAGFGSFSCVNYELRRIDNLVSPNVPLPRCSRHPLRQQLHEPLSVSYVSVVHLLVRA